MKQHVVQNNDSFEERLRTGLDRLAHADPSQVPGDFNPDMMRLASNTQHPPRRIAPMLAVAAAVVAVMVGALTFFASRNSDPTVADRSTSGVSDTAEPTATSSNEPPAPAAFADSVTTTTLFGLDADGWQLAQLVVDDGGTLATYMRLDHMTDESGGPVVTVSTGTAISLDPVVAADWDRLKQLAEVEVLGASQQLRSGIDDTVHATRWRTTGGIDVAVSAADITSAETSELLLALRPLTAEESSQVLTRFDSERAPTSTTPE